MLEIRDWLNNHQYSADQMKENCLCQQNCTKSPEQQLVVWMVRGTPVHWSSPQPYKLLFL